MTTAVLSERTRVSLRPLAMPAEHGGWAFLLEPIALGLLVAPSATGALIALAVVAAFLLRHPLKLTMQDWMRQRRYPRTRACEALTLGFANAVCGLLIAATLISGWRPLIALAAALPFALTQFSYDLRGRGRELIAEIAGAIASGAVVTAIALVTRSTEFAFLLWLLMLARAIPSVLYVRSALRGESRTIMLAAHATAIVIAAFVSWTSTIATALLLARAIPSARGLRAQAIGVREFGWGASFVILSAL